MALRTVASLPGTMCDFRLWSLVKPFISSSIDLMHVPIENEFGLPEIDLLLERYMQKTGHLLGFSMGGYLALRYAIERPDLVKSLVLVACSAGALSQNEVKKREATIEALSDGGSIYRGMDRSRLRQYVCDHGPASIVIESIVNNMDRDLGKNVLLKQLKAMTHRESLMKKLHLISCPVLIIGSLDDQVVPFSEIVEMGKNIDKSKIVSIENCGHMIPLECPEALSQSLCKFYRNVC